MGHLHVDATSARADTEPPGWFGGADPQRGRPARAHGLHLVLVPRPPRAGPSAGSVPGTQSAQAAPGPIVPSHDALHWHSCSGELATEGVPDCTMLSVPLNYADPGGRHISLALDMVPATAPPSQQQGIMLVNPGGPGGDGLTLAAEVAQTPQPKRGR